MPKVIRLENEKIILDGYPQGSSVRGLGIPTAIELSRLHLFKSDMESVCKWISQAKVLTVSDNSMKEALYIAALIKFMACFDGTFGLRKNPLRKKHIFHGTDRTCFYQLLNIRNKMVAHDEHLYPGEFPLIIMDQNATAIEANSMIFRIAFSAMKEAVDLERLAKLAKKWIEAAFEEIAKEIVDEINTLSTEDRRFLLDTTPEFTININQSENRF